jgi:hypothetical protein
VVVLFTNQTNQSRATGPPTFTLLIDVGGDVVPQCMMVILRLLSGAVQLTWQYSAQVKQSSSQQL